MKKCNNCAAVIRPDAVFCPVCGSPDLSQVTAQKRDGRISSVIKAVLCVVAFLVVQFIVTLIYLFSATLWLSSDGGMTEDELTKLITELLNSHTVIIGIISNIVTVVIFAIYFLIRRRNICRELGMRRFPPILVPLCAVFGYAMQYALGFVTAIIPWPVEWITSHSEGTSTVITGSLLLVILGTSVITGFAEETVFRVLSMERLGRAYGGTACVIISAVIFGAAHMNPISFFYATVLGIFLGLIYKKYRSVWPCAIVHMAFNLASILGLPDSSVLLYFSVVAVSMGISIIAAYFIFSDIKSTEE